MPFCLDIQIILNCVRFNMIPNNLKLSNLRHVLRMAKDLRVMLLDSLVVFQRTKTRMVILRERIRKKKKWEASYSLPSSGYITLP